MWSTQPIHSQLSTAISQLLLHVDLMKRDIRRTQNINADQYGQIFMNLKKMIWNHILEGIITCADIENCDTIQKTKITEFIQKFKRKFCRKITM